MPETGPIELLPILVANLGNDGARDYLEGVALAEGTVRLPLVSPPMDRSPHALEVYTPGHPTPLLLVAEPLGAPAKEGYPLRLRLPGAKKRSKASPKATLAYRSDLRPKRNTASTHELTEKHARDLEGEPSSTAPKSGDRHVGRQLAGGKLVIEERVGKGGAGTVYRARHRDLDMPVAVKVMHESFQKDVDFCRCFHAEALSASRLDHPNLTRVLDFGQEPDGLLYIAMEFLDGRSLRDILEEEKKLPLDRVVRLMVQVCSGLTHAHARDIVHRDIKPENLVLVKGLDDDGREIEQVKVCDFGIAHRATSEKAAAFAGTPEYMSPEQCKGEEADARSDVYACGVVLYELLTGAVPITGNNLTQILWRQQTMEPEPPSRHVQLDSKVDRVILKALAKEREARHQSMRELRADLRSLGDEVAIHTSGGYWKELEPLSERMPRTSSGQMRKADPAAPQEGPDWLERGQGYMASIMPSMMPSRPASSSSAPAAGSQPPASERSVAPFLRQLAETTDPAKFAALVMPLELKMRALANQGQTAALWGLASTLDGIAGEGAQLPGTRAAYAAQIVKVLDDPQLLAPLTEKALDFAEDRQGMATKLVVRAGLAGAYALYSARLKNRNFEARTRFVSIVEQIGPAALPMLRAGLERLESRLQVPGAVGMVEDLLKAVPKVADDAMGELLARYARSPETSLALLATRPLPKVWGQRARPLLMGLLSHPNEDVWIAAVQGLRELGAIDEHVVAKLEPIVLGKTPARLQVRATAIETVVHAAPEAMGTVRAMLAQAFQSTVGTTPDVEDTIVALARALIAARGDVTLVAERWRNSTTWLRARLEALLRP